VFVNRSVHGGVCVEVSALWGRSGGDVDGAADCEAELSIGAALIDGDFGEAVSVLEFRCELNSAIALSIVASRALAIVDVRPIICRRPPRYRLP
jgi:hypothetical protein